MVNQINHRYLYFGPIIGHTKCNSDLCNELLQRGTKTVNSHHRHLAGHIEKENIFDTNDKVWFIENFKSYFLPYFKKLQDKNDPNYYYGMRPFNEIWLANLWINFMKKGEYNPPHGHNGNFSFVLYLQVPAELQKEDESFEGSGFGPGTINFLYGEQQNNIRTSHGILPVKNDLIIFPASLKHTVPPFKSDVERISVSGNWYITDTVNNKSKQINEEKIIISK